MQAYQSRKFALMLHWKIDLIFIYLCGDIFTPSNKFLIKPPLVSCTTWQGSCGETARNQAMIHCYVICGNLSFVFWLIGKLGEGVFGPLHLAISSSLN